MMVHKKHKARCSKVDFFFLNLLYFGLHFSLCRMQAVHPTLFTYTHAFPLMNFTQLLRCIAASLLRHITAPSMRKQ